MAEHQVLFCPFCRDSFEGCETCPVHDLPLVPFSKLSPSPIDLEPHDDETSDPVDLDREPCAPLDPRYGRGLVALGAVLIGAALPLGLARFEGAPALRTYELARALPSLWTLGLVSFTVLYALARRRSPRALRGLRLLVPVLGVLSLIVLISAIVRRLGSAVSFGPAVYAIALGALLLLFGGVRLGALGQRDTAAASRTSQ